jgi:hypothetical protein
VKLYEHKDFDQAVLAAAEHFKARGLRPAFVEKDYFVSAALRAIGQEVDALIVERDPSKRLE